MATKPLPYITANPNPRPRPDVGGDCRPAKRAGKRRRTLSWPGRPATLELIKNAAATGATIEPGALENAPTFRFIPAERPLEEPRDSFDGPAYGEPSKLKPVAIRCDNPRCLCRNSKSGWRHKPLTGGDRYPPGIARDRELERALRAYQDKNDPKPLREYLRELAATPERRAELERETAVREAMETTAQALEIAAREIRRTARTSGRLVRALTKRAKESSDG